MKKIHILILLFIVLVTPNDLYGQACCSSGAPILGSLQLPGSSQGNFQFALSYQYNSLQDVIDISQRLDDQTRQRYTHSLTLEGNYGISDRLAISALFALVQQGRIINSQIGQENTLITGGMSDAVLLLNYTVIPSSVFTQRTFSIGVGPKIPLGKFTQKANGILVPYDMQPGTGAWDAVIWGYFSQGFRPAPFTTFLTGAYRITGENSLGYEFGDELILSGGLSYAALTFLSASLIFQYRSVTPDQLNSADITNTGGAWVNLAPGISVDVMNSVSLSLSGEIPIYRKLQGTQLTTTYRLGFSTYFSFQQRRVK